MSEPSPKDGDTRSASEINFEAALRNGSGSRAFLGPDEADARIPDHTRCIACRYDLSGGHQGPCPECGFSIGPEEISRWCLRVAWESRFPMRWFVAAALSAPIVYALGAAAFGQHTGPGFAAIIVLSFTIGGMFITGEILAWLGDPTDRRIARRIWYTSDVLIILPILAIAPAAAAVLEVAIIEAWTGTDGAFLFLITLFGFVFWVLGSLAVLVVACTTLGSVWHSHALRWNRVQLTIITLAILVQFPANLFAGFIGGGLAVSGAMRQIDADLWLLDQD